MLQGSDSIRCKDGFPLGKDFDELIKGQPTFDTPEVEPHLPSSRHS